MKSKCSFTLKALTSLVLVLLLLFGTMSTGLAAAVDNLAESGWNIYVPSGTVYYDFTDVGISISQQYDSSKRGANYFNGSNNNWTQGYSSTAGGTVISQSFSSAISSTTSSASFIKTDVGGWADITGKSYSTGYNVASVYDDGSGFNWMKNVTFSEDTVLYFNFNTWWNNTTSYHYLQLTKTSSTYKVNVPLYKLSSYTSNNSAALTNSASGSNGEVYFATVPAGTYFKCRLLRQKTSNASTISSSNTYNITGGFQVTTGTYNTYGASSAVSSDSDGAGKSWTWVNHTSTASLTTDADDPVIGDEITLSPSINNTRLNTLDSTAYSVTLDGSAATSGTDYTIAGNKFTPLKAGNFGITATATYHAKGFTSKTATAASSAVTVTVGAGTSPVIDTFTIDSGSSKTLNIGETATLDSSTSNADGYTVYYSTSSDKISIDGTTVKALAPVTNATITATLSNDGGTTAADTATVTVTVNTPTIASYYYTSNSVKSLLIGEATGTPTKSLTSDTYNASSTITWKYYLSSSGATVENNYATINNTTGVLTAKSTYTAVTSSNQSAYAEATITYNGESYTTVRKARTYNVYAYFLYGFGTSGWAKSSSNMFAYDSTRSVWTVSKTLTAKTYAASGDDGFKVVKNVNGTATYYQFNGTLTMTRSNNDNTNTSIGTSGSSNIGLTADVAGTYIFDLALTNNTTPSTIKPHYPQKITYSKNGRTTTAFPSTTAYVTYNTAIGSAPATTPAATGYTFTGWKKSGESTAFDFANTKITSETTINAQWEEVTAGIALTAYTDGNISTTGGTIRIDGTDVTSTSGVGITSSKTLVANVKTAQGYLFAGWETAGDNASHIKLYTNSGCTTAYTAGDTTHTTIYIKTDGTSGMTTSNSIIKAMFVNGNRTITTGKMAAVDNTGYSTANAGSISPSITGGGGAVVGNTVTLTAPATTSGGGYDYQFVGWYSSASSASTAAFNMTPVSSDASYSFTLETTSDLNYYAMYKRVYYATFYKTWEYNSTTGKFIYKTAPPRTVTVKRGSTTIATFTYAENEEAESEAVTRTATGSYNEGDKLQFLAGDTIEAKYASLASSDVIRGVFYNNAIRYTTSNQPDNLYLNRVEQTGPFDNEDNDGYVNGDDNWGTTANPYTYSITTTLFADENYYIGTAAYSTIHGNTNSYKGTITQSTHTVSWTAESNYLNIDIELGSEKKFVFSDYDNTVITSDNTDEYFAVGETVTGHLSVKAAGNATQLNTITKANIKFYYYDAANKTYTNASGVPVAAADRVEIPANTITVTGSATSANSGATAGGALAFEGTMIATDIYVDLDLKVTYKVYIGSKIVSDEIGNKTYFAQVATVTSTPSTSGQSAKTAPSNAVYNTSNNTIYTGDTVTLTYSFSSSDFASTYMFLGWYKGTSSGPDLSSGRLSTKDTYTYKPSADVYVFAVGTRDMYINGSKYITGANSDWNQVNNVPQNFKMNFDPTFSQQVDGVTKYGRYYWTIDDVKFASASRDYNNGAGVGSADYGSGIGTVYYWSNNNNIGNSFFAIFDSATGWSRDHWGGVATFSNTTHAGVHFGKAVKNGVGYNTTVAQEGCGWIDFDETNYQGYSSPLTIYYYPASGFEVVSSYVYPHVYLSNGYKNIDTATPSNVSLSVNGTSSGSNSSGSNTTQGKAYYDGAGWTTLSEEGTVRDIQIKAKDATIEISKTVASASYKVSTFVVYDLYDDSVKAYSPTTTSGTTYKLSLKMQTGHNLYIVPIVESTSANMKVIVDATQLNKDQWGDLVGCYAWYTDGGKAYGNYPGQLMIPSDDGLTLSANFPATHGSSGTLAGITFSNYVDGSNTWLGGSVGDGTVMSSDIISGNYNSVGTGDYLKTNCKVQTYDYREPVAFYANRDTNATSFLMNFALKSGNSSTQAAMTSRHSELAKSTTKIPGSFTHTHSNGSTTSTLTFAKSDFEYLTTADGDTYADMNGVPISNKPTASFYVVAKGQVTYTTGSLVRAFYSGNNYDTVTGVTYPNTGSASGASVSQAYAVEWYVYDASGNYITNILSAGYADKTTVGGTTTLIGQELLNQGYAIDGKAVAICYDSPRYCYNKVNNMENTGTSFDAYRFAGQWYQQNAYTTAKVYAEVGMLTDNGEELPGASTAAYGSATVSVDTTKLDYPTFGTFGSTAGVNWGEACIADGEKQAISLTASSTNFAGWYYYDAEGEFTLLTTDTVLKPTFSKDVTYYAMYEARATYSYLYTGREGGTNAKSYSVDGGELTEAEMGATPANTVAKTRTDFGTKTPGADTVSIFKKTITWNNSVTTAMLDNSTAYTMKISNATITTARFTVTAHYKSNAGGSWATKAKEADYNTAVDFTAENSNTSLTGYYTGHRFIGWYECNSEGNLVTPYMLLSTQHNYGMVVTKDLHIRAVYDDDGITNPTDDAWYVFVDDHEITREKYTATSGTYYNDTIIRVRNNADGTKTTLPTGAEVGILVIDANKSGLSTTAGTTNLTNFAENLESGQTGKIGSTGRTVTKVSTTSLTRFGRADLATRKDFSVADDTGYSVYAYYKSPSGAYTFTLVNTGTYTVG